MSTRTINFNEWKKKQQAELAVASSITLKRRLISYREILSEYLHIRGEAKLENLTCRKRSDLFREAMFHYIKQ